MFQDRHRRCQSLVFSPDEERRRHNIAVAFGDSLFSQVKGEYDPKMGALTREAKMHMCGMTGSIYLIL